MERERSGSSREPATVLLVDDHDDSRAMYALSLQQRLAGGGGCTWVTTS
ncbi:MAG TPA: hypothetical protein VMF13_19750 [Luteitalea sp.]|nr:hypothetical protein [Luteitalea sp.]